MSDGRTFMEQVLDGAVFADEIDDFVDAWHEGLGDTDLPAFLGMRDDEYALWVSSPDHLGTIIAARANHRSLSEAVNDNYQDLKMAAQADGQGALQKLRIWLIRNGHTG